MPASDVGDAARSVKIRELRKYLSARGVSPEVFAKEVQLSNMTIRRWLRRKDSEDIPEKYHPVLHPILKCRAHYMIPASAALSVESLMTEIEKSGAEFHGPCGLGDVEKLDRDLDEKLKSTRLDRIFMDHCKKLMRAIRSPRVSLRSKAIAAGALIYFISPIDLIPDHIPVIGYMDDLAVLSLAVNTLAKESEKAEKEQAKAT